MNNMKPWTIIPWITPLLIAIFDLSTCSPTSLTANQTQEIEFTSEEKAAMLRQALEMQKTFKDSFMKGKFPKFKEKNHENEDAKLRLEENPYDLIKLRNQGNKHDEKSAGSNDGMPDQADGDEEIVRWWEGRNDEDIAGKFHMTSNQFRKAADLMLQWIDDRLTDLDDLYEKTLEVGRVTGVPVDHIINEQLHPKVVEFVKISQKSAGNPFASDGMTGDDGHRFSNPIKE